MGEPEGVSTSWDMSQERVFIENLLCQRFNFFLVVFSVVLAGAAAATTRGKQTAILVLGCIVSALLALTIYRTYAKLMAILGFLHAIPDHPVAVSTRRVEEQRLRGLFPVNHIIGIIIPMLCTTSLAVAAALSWGAYLPAK